MGSQRGGQSWACTQTHCLDMKVQTFVLTLISPITKESVSGALLNFYRHKLFLRSNTDYLFFNSMWVHLFEVKKKANLSSKKKEKKRKESVIVIFWNWDRDWLQKSIRKCLGIMEIFTFIMVTVERTVYRMQWLLN